MTSFINTLHLRNRTLIFQDKQNCQWFSPFAIISIALSIAVFFPVDMCYRPYGIHVKKDIKSFFFICFTLAMSVASLVTPNPHPHQFAPTNPTAMKNIESAASVDVTVVKHISLSINSISDRYFILPPKIQLGALYIYYKIKQNRS